METAIKAQNLTKSYHRARGIIDLSITVNKGDIYGFIGSNGAGKSTTIRVLLGLIKRNSGKVEVFGEDIKRRRREILSGIGYIPSEASYYANMRVSDAIRMSADLRRMDCAREARRLCGILSLDTARKVEELSFGNRKKLGIVLALQHRPDLLILDEATGGLDPLIQKAFWELIAERHKQGATIFFSSHVLSEIQQHCNRAAIIREGRLVVEDSVSSLSRSAAKRVTLRGCSNMPEGFPGAIGMTWLDNNASFLFQGDYRKMLSDLQSISFEDISITEPDMEDIFMHFYEKDGKPA